jgi:arginine deiminase
MTHSSDHPVYIFNEVDPLQEVLVWGEPGCEALLAQLLPKSKSLFLTYYEVPEARAEFRRMQVLIENEGVIVTRARDAYVRVLARQEIPGLPASLAELQERFLRRADEYLEDHKAEKSEELQASGLDISAEDIHAQVRRDIQTVLREDVQQYGEGSAIKLNHQLSFSHELPICNIFYGRDQSNTLGDRILLSSMRWEVRQPEIEIYKQVLTELGCSKYMVEIEEGSIEGGDSIILADTCYVGVGARTTLSAVKDLYRKIGKRLAERGIQIVAVMNERHEREASAPSNPTTEHMRAMHLDMFWVPLASNLVVAGGEMDSRRVIHVTEENGTIVTKDLGGFRNFLQEKGIEVIEVTPQEQRDYATNLLNFGHRKVLVALSKNERVNRELERRGFHVITAELTKLVGGYGAAHCLTAPIIRTHE